MVDVLVTGGAGYIGSTVVSALLDAGHQPVIIDDLSTGSRSNVGDLPFREGDIADRALVREVLRQHRGISAVVHCAASVVVPDSVSRPAAYYRNNVVATLDLAETLADCGIADLVFSSSASIYAPGADLVVDEDSPWAPASPYARTKAVAETMLADLAEATRLRVLSLRYFNPVGADPALRTGPDLRSPSHVLGRLLDAHRRGQPFRITGVDHPTPDGTGIRDYVHVWDLARAHVAALEGFDRALAGRRHQAVNLGTGRGTSVRELIRVVEQVTGDDVTVLEEAPRPGDVAGVWTRTTRAEQLLDWRAELDLADAVRDALAWAERDRAAVVRLVG